jgi:proline iminopeptidase
MNAAPVSAGDVALLRKTYMAALGADMDRQLAIVDSAAYKEGDPEAVTARYRIHFTHALKQREHYEQLMSAMSDAFVSQGKAGIVKARAVEDRLMLDTWSKDGYDLLPALQRVRIPTIVIHGDHDFIPGDVAAHIAKAVPGARLVMLKDCGHFSYLECPSEVRTALTDFVRR